MKGLFGNKIFVNVRFGDKDVEHIVLNGKKVWSRPNLFLTSKLSDVSLGWLKTDDVVMQNPSYTLDYQRLVRVESETEFDISGAADGYYLILGE